MKGIIFLIRENYKFAAGIIIAILTYLYIESIPQSINYHDLADKRQFLYIPNALNVLSNIVMLFAGFYGIWQCFYIYSYNLLNTPSFVFYLIFFVAAIFTSISSAIYNFEPNNHNLFWFRCPSTIAMMSVLSGIICERLRFRYKILFSLSLLVFGMISSFYWQFTELNGSGDQRFYRMALVIPIFVILKVLSKHPKPIRMDVNIIYSICLLILAYITEINDHLVFKLTFNLISGVTLKNLFCGFAVLGLAKYLISKRNLKYQYNSHL